MARVVLVHGAWHGAWAWDGVLEPLVDAGHDVTAIGLPGSDGRTPASLWDQGKALAELLGEGDAPAIVVAHSHGGLVLQEAASADAGLVAGVIAVDAWFAEPGRTFLETVPSEMSELIAASVKTDQGGTDVIPAPSAALFGVVDPDQVLVVQPKLTSQPFAAFNVASGGHSFAASRTPGVAIVCEPRTLPFDSQAQAQGFEILSIVSGHDVMLLEPTSFLDLLLTSIHRLERLATSV